jgi:hypothetical protein
MLLVPRRHPVGPRLVYINLRVVSLSLILSHTHLHTLPYTLPHLRLIYPCTTAPTTPLVIHTFDNPGFESTERSFQTQFNPAIPPCPAPHSLANWSSQSQLYQGPSSGAFNLRQTTCRPLRFIIMCQLFIQYPRI